VRTLYRRLHAALMPDYNPWAAAMWWALVLLGAVVLGRSLWALRGMPLGALLQVGVGAALAMLAGFFPIRVPNSPTGFAAGDVFIFLVLLLQGPEAATVVAAAESLMGSWRGTKRWSSRIVSPAIAAVAMFCVGTLMHRALGGGGRHIEVLLPVSVVFGLVYFALSVSLISALGRLMRNERIRLSDVFTTFGWLGVIYAGGAALAALLYLVSLQAGIGVLMAMVPLLAMMLATQHYYFRQQEVAEAARRAVAEANEREAEAAARHLRELQASERRFHRAFTDASIGMALTTIDGRIVQANPALHMLLAQRADALLQVGSRELVVDEDRPSLDEALARAGQPGFEGFALELRCRSGDGAVVWLLLHCGPFAADDEGTGAPRLILQAQDVTARRDAEERLQHIAFHDSLTGLPNRRRFMELLGGAVRRARGDPTQAVALMYLDFDRFKQINDSLGHHAGDDFLVQVARRISLGLRPGDVVARLGGDEFAVLVLRMESGPAMVALTQRILESVRQPFVLSGTEFRTSASIGVTFSAFGYEHADDMLKDADAAMYQAKAAGKDCCVVFEPLNRREVPARA